MTAGYEEEHSDIARTIRDATAQLLGKLKSELGTLRPSLSPANAARLDQALALVESGIRGIRGDAAEAPAHEPPITARERQVLVRVAAGLTSKQIASELAISPRTVETHRESLMRKLDVTSVVGLTRYVIEHKITDDK